MADSHDGQTTGCPKQDQMSIDVKGSVSNILIISYIYELINFKNKPNINMAKDAD